MASETSIPAIFLMGPTAAGKTALALALHEHLPVDIISVDSSQVYRDMNIGTAKPTAEELIRAPHRLIDIRDPAESYSAAEFCRDALREMRDIAARGRIPLLVGGTMFYFRALEFGLSTLPSADAKVRRRLADEAAARGWPALHARLAELDPQTAARIAPNDQQRVQRALEIVELTGERPTALAAVSPPYVFPYRPVRIALVPSEREVLHRRIAARFKAMLDLGMLGEVETLYRRRDLGLQLPAIRTVGYRQLWEYLSGSVSYNEAVERAVIATRQLAKRQLTWIRHYPGVKSVNMSDKVPVEECLALVKGLGNGG